MKAIALLLLVAGCLASVALSARTVSKYITAQDQDRYGKIFAEGLKSTDLQAVYFSTASGGLSAADKTVEACKRLVTVYGESKLNDFERNFYLAGAWKNLACKEAIAGKVKDAVKGSLGKDAGSAQEIYFNLFAAKALGLAIDDAVKTQVGKNLQALLKKDDTLNSLGHGFAVAAEIGASGAFAFDRVEEAFVQADEVDGKMLQFEGGLSITALVVNSAFKLASSLKKPVPINAEQAVKFATYFLSRTSVQTPKGVSILLEALNTLTAEKTIAPVCIALSGNGQLQPESPVLGVKISDLLGKPLSPALAVVSTTITSKTTNEALASKVNLVPTNSDPTVFIYNLKALNPARGQYKVDIETGSYKQNLKINVLGKVKVASLEIGVGDSDSTSAVKKHSVTFSKKLDTELAADSQQKIVLRTQLVDESSGKPLNVHQAFVLLRNKATGQEIIFVAEADSSKAYKFEMDVGARSADFGYKSGTYSIELIVGDALISNSFKWLVADVNIKFASDSPKESDNTARKPRPEIIHQFRVPEKRPPRVVSDLFTGLCIAPLALLFILWAKLRTNVSNFPFSLSAVGFHLGLGAILALFGVFWLKLNMFETLRYLIPLALVTFFCGNRLLRSIAGRATEK
ncbi:ribophorin ii [Culex quinquefasciatus]|uniref:Dolichyl-diphosphooligosaccharide--protein glycosyltransferase subunit 2 n=1 Tax=Culex quinquefasciatus TaxID=7176 RepID=B0VZR0_CULQU|nr:LOW QUALITY PROTEIN: dolichyl-diphosphooligosaccharide--protein glycosyltransferase subunit 2 [Culex quinquefasciatus]EDS35152.1 ribophorin ii [Culex quinquefasciatus]|eukprot:XP_001841944.1 ribophorin ii [Culex quinquefasciatus]